MDDLEFVQRCVKGDKRCWDEFLKRYTRLIYNYIHNVLNSKTQSPADNYVQDIFQEIIHSLIKDNFKKLKSFKARGGCSLATWLRQVTVNAAIDYLRRIRPFVSIDEEREDGLSLGESLRGGSSPVSELASNEERLLQLTDCIDKLESQEKYFMELHINQEVGLERLKDVFKVSRGAIDMRKSRIVEKLRDCFKSKGFFG